MLVLWDGAAIDGAAAAVGGKFAVAASREQERGAATERPYRDDAFAHLHDDVSAGERDAEQRAVHRDARARRFDDEGLWLGIGHDLRQHAAALQTHRDALVSARQDGAAVGRDRPRCAPRMRHRGFALVGFDAAADR